ncbi:hypothetical protein BCR32DRAFT_295811 [Anaeromyces robustus]|uniref:Dickkopf N-terminal cysteine-rich domain-containing protein n=1 Tax=Anaeromyces robustus TaxID=1754192 RepID=A0A1Y1WVA1_9FUNG|nr:hypothetical protein BCR32DRAFT_295811 [Anaeromyces robustus]|eukprot:ORX77136.1 hypothetical protein BCR32DRAFT_295811 [Anaeromyces robustus]
MAMLNIKNNNKLFHLIIYLIVALQTFGYDGSKFGVFHTNYTIKDIENFKVNNSYPCPNESSFNIADNFISREGEEFTTCDYQYLCNKKNEKCILFNSPSRLAEYSSQYENIVKGNAYNDLDEENKEIILVSCSKERFKRNKCSTDTCTKNEDCFSDNCVNGVCMTNKENPIYLCGPVKENSEIKVKCLLSFEEKCNENKDCADNANCTKDKLCVIEKEPESYPEKSSIFIVIFAILIILALIFVAFKFFQWKKHANN